MTSSNCLLVDIGNSRLKWNLALGNANVFGRQTQAVDYKARSMDDVLSEQWGDIKAPIPHVAIVNVAGNTVAQQIIDWCANHWDVHPTFASSAVRFKTVTNGYKDYRQLGADRWMAVIAAHQRKPDQHSVIIDCGSAITVDVVTVDGQHKAGPIIPGRDMMLNALAANTADLDNRYDKNSGSSGLSGSVFADGTHAAVVNGVNFAIGKALDTIIHDIRETLAGAGNDAQVEILVTGGAAKQVMPLTGITHYTLEPDLILHGLYIVNAAQLT